MGGWIDGSKSHFKDCLQQSKSHCKNKILKLEEKIILPILMNNYFGQYKNNNFDFSLATILNNLLSICKLT